MVRQVFLVAGLSLIAATAFAQSTPSGANPPSAGTAVQPAASPSAPSDSVSEAPVGPALRNVTVAFRPAETAAAAAMPIQASERQSVTLMIIGGGMLLGGLIIGDDAGTAIAVGGLVVGLIGLYQYLQ